MGHCARQAGRGRYAAHAKLRALLTAAGEELPDVPLYYSLHAICKTLHTTPPSADAVRSALVNAGEGFYFLVRAWVSRVRGFVGLSRLWSLGRCCAPSRTSRPYIQAFTCIWWLLTLQWG
jgi:hypothetical protein